MTDFRVYEAPSFFARRSYDHGRTSPYAPTGWMPQFIRTYPIKFR